MLHPKSLMKNAKTKLRAIYKKKHIKRWSYTSIRAYTYIHESPSLAKKKVQKNNTTKDVITVTGNKREFSKRKLGESSLSNNEDNCYFSFCYPKDYIMKMGDFLYWKIGFIDFVVLKRCKC